MRYTAFGHRAGLRVSEYALGTANFGTGWGAGAEPDEARRIFHRFAEAGGTFLDSADSYLAALDVQLTDEQYARLDKVSAMPLGGSARGRRGQRHRPGRAGGLSPETRRRRALRAGTDHCRADAERADQKTRQTVS
ncbi:aldo/keto reductase [Streptomyces sp. NBC_01166]|uniref:aldo/keto reductase n=1 Tax=Streptomyces sp. NBC_01166 TaxID=2903755 RepID=UPI0038701A68